ncbi:MAG: hypothetical protein IPJ65_20360 [Archangiaceae bacterium]|nr:hypothetical protein [Archangiaceae bacterium]
MRKLEDAPAAVRTRFARDLKRPHQAPNPQPGTSPGAARYASAYEPAPTDTQKKPPAPTHRLTANEKQIIETKVRERVKWMVDHGYPPVSEAQLKQIIAKGEAFVVRQGGFSTRDRDDIGFRVSNFTIQIDSMVAAVTGNGLGGGGGLGSVP